MLAPFSTPCRPLASSRRRSLRSCCADVAEVSAAEPASPPSSDTPFLLVRNELDNRDFVESQRSGVSDPLFKGERLGVDADVAEGLFSSPLRDLSAVREGLFIPHRFLDAVSLFIAKHYNSGLPRSPPLLLIWGKSGTGKSLMLSACACRDARLAET